jgi:hypothetical protein
MLTRRRLLGNTLAGLSSSLWLPLSTAAGASFQPNRNSLGQYKVPEWFRDHHSAATQDR